MKRLKKVISKILLIILLSMLIIQLLPSSSTEAVDKTFTYDDFPYNIKFKDIAAGYNFTLALDEDGYLWTFGSGTCSSSLVLDGTAANAMILSHEDRGYPKKVSDKKFSQIYAGNYNAFVIDEEGFLFGWGLNSKYQLGDGTVANADALTAIKPNLYFTKVDTTQNSTAAIDENGDVWVWGTFGTVDSSYNIENISKQYSIPTKISNETNTRFIDVAVTKYSCAAIDENGYLWTWGFDGPIRKYYNSNNSMYYYPVSHYGLLGNNNDVDDTSEIQSITKIKENVVYKKIDAGEHHIIAIDENGYPWSWGNGFNGVTGLGDTNIYTEPTIITNKRKFTDMYINYESNIALDTNGSVWVWGSGENYQHGDRSDSVKTNITNIQVEEKYKKVAISNSHSLLLKEDGTLYGCGEATVSKTGYALGIGSKNSTGSSITGSESGSIEFIQITNPISNYTVTFMNGTEVVETQTVETGSAATAPTLTREGYTLSWDTDFSNVTSDLTVKAIWTANTNTPYKVEHYKRNLDAEVVGYDLFETENLSGTTDALALAVAKTYEGFTENTTYESRIERGNIAADGSLVLKLYYDRNNYNIAYNLNGGTATSTLTPTYVYGKELILSNKVEKQGYAFAGWYDNSSLTGTAVTAISATEIGDKNFYARWTQNEFIVTFKDGANIAKTETVTKGKGATAPSLTKAGYTLSWDTDFSNITSDLTVNAIWTANRNTPYRVEHYKRNLDTEVVGYDLFETENLSGTTDTTVTAIAKTYTGFTENTAHESRVETGTIAGDGSLVLKLYYDRNSYNITYELNGGTAKGTLTKSYTYGKEIILSSKVEKQGYVFGGWYDNSGLTGTAVTAISATETGDKTFYAKWISDDQYSIISEKYNIDVQENYITKVSPNTNVQALISNLNTNGTAKVLNAKGEELAKDALVGTGCKVQVDYKGTKYEYEVAVRGDIDGNGKITVTDLSMLNQVLVKKLTVTGAKEKATDIDYSKKITVTDLSMMNQALVGKINL